MTCAPLFPLPRLGVGAGMTLLVLGTALLSSTVSGETKEGIFCLSVDGNSYSCGRSLKGCCYRQFGPMYPKVGCRAGDVSPSDCQKECWVEGKGAIQCTCANKDNCNGATDNPWGGDPVYKDHHAQGSRPGSRPGSPPGPGSGSSSTGPSRNNATLLLIVLLAFGSLPHLF